MKKAKVLLASIAILATVGGVFAFKAKSSFGPKIFYNTTYSASCPRTITAGELTALNHGVFNAYATTASSGCYTLTGVLTSE